MNKTEEAFEAVNFARMLDTADRFLNNMAVKFALKNNKIEEADAIIQMFINKDDGHIK